MGQKGVQRPLQKLFSWVRKQSNKVKTFLGVFTVLTLLVTLKLLIHEHNHFFVLAEFAHFVGILVLIYKLTTHKTCSGVTLCDSTQLRRVRDIWMSCLSLKTQQLTATFLFARLFCSLQIEGDIHTILDLVTLVATFWLIFMMKYKLKSSYMADLDNMKKYIVIVPSLVIAFFIHPRTNNLILSILWAFAVYIEGVSVLPQLRLMQNVKIIEPFTAHYVFALGVSRFFSCAHWIIKVYDTSGSYLSLSGGGFFWIPMIILAEIVQTFVLADFCYYYVKSVMQGQMMVRLPA
uniref:ER lumen protein retaining receptor n=1 Tax=Solanum tuberosum TaxID=4113 RepID=M1BUK2_SOLTU